ncbi:hypothetical protein H4W81_003127 [Nonomuraea africana]|uniref:Antibiotic biosynthesis monooxygenase n=1 Tax=Nonomuraea africana TaxID=46171 RepID=A0ABR9KE94_9ACTN|nr:hypothetical protein [Nonomuraea africana]
MIVSVSTEFQDSPGHAERLEAAVGRLVNRARCDGR